MELNYNFKDLDKVPISKEKVVSIIVNLYNQGYTIAVGSDSQAFYDNISFVTTV